MGTFASVMAVVLGFGAVCIVYTLINVLRVCDPNEVLIVSGMGSIKDGRRIGYDFTKGGRMLVYPVINKAHRMDLRNMTIDVSVRNAYSAGGVPLNIEGVAALKVSGDWPLLNNAVERFLGKSRVEIMKIAKETLEGNLRGVLARLTPEQVNHDKDAFAQSLIEEAGKDLARLGLVLDTLKIQNVRDEVGYLDCLGRKKRSELLMQSRIAEASNKAEAKIREAENRQQAVLRQLENQTRIVQAEAETAIVDARTRRESEIAAVQAEVAKELARAEAEIAVQRARIDQVRLRLQADEVQPAHAQREKMIADAKAEVAPILENGKATAKMLTDIIRSMKRAGTNARDIFLVQKLDSLLASFLRTVQAVQVDRITMIDQRLTDGGGGGSLAARALVGSEQIKSTLGLDLPQMVQDLSRAAQDKLRGG